jgi:hypothetical protein
MAVRGLVQANLTLRHPTTWTHSQPSSSIPASSNIGWPAPPEEIAALYLASNDATFLNGTNLLVDAAWAVSGCRDMRPFRGPIGWNQRTQA